MIELFETPKSEDKWLKFDFLKDWYEGTVYYMEFSKVNQDIKVVKAFLEIRDRRISLKESPFGES